MAHCDHTHDLPHVVIVGAGFGGLSAAAKLAHAPVHVTLIDRRNHHLFQPLLYQVATAGLSPNQIATPVRTTVRRQTNTDVVLDEVTASLDACGRTEFVSLLRTLAGGGRTAGSAVRLGRWRDDVTDCRPWRSAA